MTNFVAAVSKRHVDSLFCWSCIQARDPELPKAVLPLVIDGVAKGGRETHALTWNVPYGFRKAGTWTTRKTFF